MDATVGFAAHLAQLLLLSLVVIGPLPLCFCLLSAFAADGRKTPFGHAHFSVFLVWSVSQVALLLILGSVHLLNAAALAIGEVVLIAAGVWRWRQAHRNSTQGSRWDGLWPRQAPSAVTAGLVFALMVVGLVLAWEIITTSVRNFDSLAYHLPIVARWVEQGHFARFPELGQTARYPLNFELFSVLLFLPLRDDAFVAIPNLIAWVNLGLGITLLARRLTSSTEAAVAAAALVLTLPVMLDRVAAIQPDIGLTTFFVAALYFGLRAREDAGAGDGILFLISLALLAGSKTSGPGYAAVVVVTLMLGRWFSSRSEPKSPAGKDPGRERALRERLSEVATALGSRERALGWLALALFVGGFWYLRNVIQLGNPLGLLEVKLLGVTILPGSLDASYLRQTTLASVFEFSRGDHWGLLARVARQWLGLPFASLALFVLAGGILAAVRRRLRPHLAWALAFLALTTFAAYWNTPYSGDNGSHGWQLTPWIHVGLRYAFPFLAVVGVAAALGMRSLRLPAMVLLPLPVISCMLGPLLTLTPGAWVLRLAVLVALVPTAALVAIGRGRRWHAAFRPAVLSAVGVVLVVVFSFAGRGERTADRARAYGAVFDWMEENVAADEVVGYASTETIYPLWGTGWTRHVVSADPETARLASWVSSLRSRGIGILTVGHAPPTSSGQESAARVHKWVRLPNGPFEMLRDYDSVRFDLGVYRLRAR